MNSIVLDDPAELLQHVKTEVAVTGYRANGQHAIDTFAQLTDDMQWIHTDVERAREESPYESTVAHGFLTLSFLSSFLNEAVRVDGVKMLVSVGLSSVRFLNPVPSGGRIRARVRLRDCSNDADEFVAATWRFTIECEGIRFPCCIADWQVRYYR
jgi:acyl dehydratase